MRWRRIREALGRPRVRLWVRRAILAGCALLTIFAMGAVVAWHRSPFPLERLGQWGESSVIRDSEGVTLLASVGPGDQWRLPIPLEQMSPWLVKATIAVEDERFMNHGGVDAIAVCRAVCDNVLKGRRVSGASTLTMQLCRMMDDRERTYTAKAIESFRALQLERLKSKDEIVELYLNTAPYGGNVRGVEAAAQRYFGRSARELSLGEAALIVGLPKSPERYRPDRAMDRALIRRRTVLRRMSELDLISEATRKLVESQPVELVRRANRTLGRHAAVLALQRRPGGGTTTLDPGIQFELERLVRAHQATLSEGTQIAAAVVEISTGNLTALQGSTDFDDAFVGQVNGALAWRSPGSTLKPFVYAAAFEIRRLASESFVHDVRIDRAGWSPRNFDGEYRGRVTVSEALRESLNIPAIHVAETLGLNRCAGYLESVGVQWRGAAADAAGAGLVVGAAEVRLLDLVNAYATLGRGGVHRPVRFFHDESGESRRVISGNVCRVIDEILSSTTRLPAGMEGRTSETAPWFMWKTGTSSGRRDAWAVGHNRRYALGVWVGRFYGTGRPEYVGGKVAEPLLARLFGLSAIQNLEAQRAPDAIQVLNPLPPPKELANELRILSPSDSTVFIATSATANIYARANQDDGVMWFLDGARVEEASFGPLSVPRGRHRLLCVSDVGASAGVEFIVR